MKKALFNPTSRRFDIADVPVPKPTPGTLLIEVKACSVCGTDLRAFKYDPDPQAEIFERELGVPMIATMGHQIAGVIAALGKGMDNYQVGDRVALQGPGGGYANYVLAPAAQRIADRVSFAEASFLEPLNVALNCIKASRWQPGTTAIVYGLGSIGILLAQALRAKGCRNLIGVDIDNDRLALATQFGCAQLINATESDHKEKLAALINATQVVAFECSGSPQALSALTRALPSNQQLVLVAGYGPGATVNLNEIVLKGLNLQGVLGYIDYLEEAAALVADKNVDVSCCYSLVAPLTDINPAIQRLLARRETGVVITPCSSGPDSLAATGMGKP